MILLGRPDSAQALLRAVQGSPLCNLASFTHALVAIAVFRLPCRRTSVKMQDMARTQWRATGPFATLRTISARTRFP